MKTIEKYFNVVMFIMLYKHNKYKSVGESLVCEHSFECYSKVLSRDTVYYIVKR